MPEPDVLVHLDVLHHLPQGVFILRRDGTVSFWNQRLEDWTGILRATIVGHPVEAHFPHLGTPKYTLRFEPLFEGGAPATFASQFHPQFVTCSLPSGQPRIQQTIAKALWDEPTQEWQALIIIQDISDLHRQVAESQRLRKQAQAEISQTKKHQDLLEAIRHIESTFISTKNAHQTFDEVLAQLLAISESEYGFIGEIKEKDGQPYLKTHAITNISWNEETQALYDQFAPNMEFFNLHTLFGKVLTTGEVVIANDPQHDPRKGGLPEGHPALNAFLGVPMYHGGQFLGMAGLSNRAQGYDSELVEYLQPLLASCGKILHAFRNEQERHAVQIALHESQERLTLATASAKMGIWDWDITTNNLTWDSKMLELYGLDADQFSGAYEAWTQGLHPADKSHAESAIQQALDNSKEFNTEFRVVWPDESIHVIAAHGLVQRDSRGQPSRMTGVNWDITSSREQKRELQLLSERLVLATAYTGLGIWDWDITQNILSWDETMYKLYGITPEKFGGAYEAWINGVHPEDREYAEEASRLALANEKDFNTEFRVVWDDQTIHHLAARGIIQRDEDEKPIRMIGVNWDITSEKEHERAQAHLHRAIDQGIEGLALLDQEGKYTYINRAHANMYGYQTAELLGQSWKLLYSKDQLDVIEKSSLPNLRNFGNWQGELLGLCKNGTTIPVEISLSLLTNPDGLSAGLVCTCRDISERKDAEAVITETTQALEQQNLELATTRDQALAAARSKSDFLATMSHEIRTPLNGVIGMTTLLMDTGLNTDQQEMMETVKHSGEFLLTIINDILDFSKIDAGKLDLENIDFDVRKAVDEVLDILAERASQKNLDLIGLVYATTPLQLVGDPGRIRQILFNLIGNAIKFTHAGEIVIDVSMIETSRDTTTLRFAVTDTGIGITKEVQQRLFDSFTQADSSTTRKFGGTGLGLAISKQLVNLMQGEIGVISEQGRGSTFWFTIPFAHGATLSPTPVPNASLKGQRVFIVESNDTIRFLLQHYAESWGMICEVTPNGREGLALLKQRAKEKQSFDVAILDHTISENTHEDGLSLSKHIRQDPAISKIPLILLTALGKRGEGKLAQDAGFNAYLTKPIRHQQLQQCLQMILGDEQQTTSPTSAQSSSLITRHTVEEAQAQTQAHVLLAEDNVVNQKVAVRMLQKIGCRVDVVENGQEALEALGRTAYTLVFMDCQMPEMDGLEATRKIRKAEREMLEGKSKRSEEEKEGQELKDSTSSFSLLPSHSRLPIIALTANALSGDRETCLEAGMDDFLAKPVGISDLQTMLQKWGPQTKNNNSEDQHMSNHTQKNPTALPPSLDETILNDLKTLGGDDDPEFFLTLVDQFLEDLPRHLESIQQALNDQDHEALVKAAHTCKGSSRSIGATILADISYTLESMGREGTVEGGHEKFSQWLKEQERTALALQQVKSEMLEVRS